MRSVLVTIRADKVTLLDLFFDYFPRTLSRNHLSDGSNFLYSGSMVVFHDRRGVKKATVLTGL